MAKIRWLLGESGWGGVDSDYTITLNKAHTKAVYHFEDGGEIVFNGKNLKMVEGEITGGAVTKVTFINGDDDTFIVADGHYKAEKLGQAAIDDEGYGIRNALYGGDDLIIGSNGMDTIPGGNGDDHIVGGRDDDFMDGESGNDKLTGGKGSDYFQISSSDGVGREVITDLHTKGLEQDTFSTDLDIVKTKSVHHHEDTLLVASNGSTILLEHVTKQEWLDYIEMPL